VPVDQLETACLVLPSAPRNEDCAVADSGSIPGAGALRYQRQRYRRESPARAVIILAPLDGSEDRWLPIAAAYNAHIDFAAPDVANSPYGELMMLAGAADAPGDEGASYLYRFAGGTLEDIDDRGWLDTLKSRLPDGMRVEPGIATDYTKMSAVAVIAKSESTCCPVGGRAIITLAIEDQRVVVKDVTFEAQ
jgi:hypothetical protein